MKGELNAEELEELYQMFGKINQARSEIQAGLTALHVYSETVSEINCLSSEDSEYGEDLCRKALHQLSLIKNAELARINIQEYKTVLENKFEILARCAGGEAV